MGPVAIVLIVVSSLAVAALGALLAINHCKRRSRGTGGGVFATLAMRLTNANNNRAVNRCGMGCDLPAAGDRVFFRAGFVPALSASESIAAFGIFDDEQTHHLRARAEQKTRQLAEYGMPLFCDDVELILSFTDESDLYVTLLKACRTTGMGSESTLDRYRDYLYHLEMAMGHLPPYIGRTFRSIDIQVVATSYEVGSIITWQNPSSASKVERMVSEFMRVVEEQEPSSQKASPLPGSRVTSFDVEGPVSFPASSDGEGPESSQKRLFGTIFIIESTRGRDISMFSAFPEEEEVLFPLNSRFRVSAHLESEQEKRGMLVSPVWSGFDLSQVVVFVLQQV